MNKLLQKFKMKPYELKQILEKKKSSKGLNITTFSFINGTLEETETIINPTSLDFSQSFINKLNGFNLDIKITPINYFSIMEYIFGDEFVVSDHQSGGGGYPDFKIKRKNDNDITFIEFKSKSDGLRKTQLKWLCENSKKSDCYVMFVDYFYYKSEAEERELSEEEMLNRVLSKYTGRHM